uniref:Uncharacterized protein n=1 Tax=Globodera rostochiensis TaxID=31243 RepID=A0A914I619_GLORO
MWPNPMACHGMAPSSDRSHRLAAPNPIILCDHDAFDVLLRLLVLLHRFKQNSLFSRPPDKIFWRILLAHKIDGIAMLACLTFIR